jgi:hypothetical protein
VGVAGQQQTGGEGGRGCGVVLRGSGVIFADARIPVLSFLSAERGSGVVLADAEGVWGSGVGRGGGGSNGSGGEGVRGSGVL